MVDHFWPLVFMVNLEMQI